MTMKSSIKSDTQGKLNKMIKGVVFSDRLVFITEFFQNSYRAKSTNVVVEVNHEEGYMTFKDNGLGLDNPNSLLLLDYSAWNTTSEGFGLGFWSWLCFDKEDTEYDRNVIVEVISKNNKFRIDKSEIMESNLVINIEETKEYTEGFEVKIYSELIKEYEVYKDIIYRVRKDGKFMPYKVILNEEEIEQETILRPLEGFSKEYSNEYFDAVLKIEKNFSYITMYYEKREVRDLYTLQNVKGNLEVKPNVLNLKEPDRRDYVYDEKYTAFRKKFEECGKDLFKEFVKTATNEDINEMASVISEYLEVEDYEGYLGIEDTIYELEEEERSIPKKAEEYYIEQDEEVLRRIIENRNSRLKINNIEITEGMAENINKLLNTIAVEDEKWVETSKIELDSTKWLEGEVTEEDIQSKKELVIEGKVWVKYNKEEIENLEKDDEEVVSTIKVNKEKKVKKRVSILDILKKTKKKVWVKSSELEEMEEIIAKSKYYGIKVFIAKNVLYEKVFELRGIAHITEIENGLVKNNIIKNVKIKSKKEQAVIDILQPACEYYNIPSDTFLIADLGMYIETTLNNEVVHREVQKNTKTDFLVKGLADGKNIYLDRKALRLNRFSLTQAESFGKVEYKLLLTILRVVSHELAHLLYNTSDNTINHYEKQDMIMDELESLYNTLF